jgi:alpha-1,3-rhamnosyltransferase
MESEKVKMGCNTLVSIVVITYNSSKYVIETLESAKAQTYQNIELIISDDCSSDDTVEICRNWINNNDDCFVRTELVTTTKNTGIPGNCNRGINAAVGEWIKLIAGDDALLMNAIENVVAIGNKNPFVDILLTMIEVYKETFDKYNLISIQPQDWQSIPAYSVNATSKVQLEHILKGGYHNAPGLFVKKKVYEQNGFFDEQYPLNEDTPFYLKMGLLDKIITFFPISTVKYRKHQYNLTSLNKKVLPYYISQSNNAIYQASLKYGKRKFIINSLWNKILISLIFRFGNKGFLANSLNKLRLTFQPIRFFNLLMKFKMISNF